MAISKQNIEKKISEYLVGKNGYKFLRKEYVEKAENVILSEYQNVYVQIQDSDLGRSKLMVGNLGKKVCKPKFEIYID